MIKFSPALLIAGVNLGRNLEDIRDLWLVAGAIVLIVLPLSYFASSRARNAIDDLLAVKRPTLMKRFLGGLLIFFPGTLILAITNYTDISRAVEQQWPGLVAQRGRQESVESPKGSNVAKAVQETLKKAISSTSATLNKRLVVLTKKVGEAQKSFMGKLKGATGENTSAQRRSKIRSVRKHDPNIWFAKENQLAAVSQGDLDSAIQYLAEDYMEAFHELEAARRVILLKEGFRVYIVKYDYSTGKVKIRLQGSKVELWTFRDALKKR